MQYGCVLCVCVYVYAFVNIQSANTFFINEKNVVTFQFRTQDLLLSSSEVSNSHIGLPLGISFNPLHFHSEILFFLLRTLP